MATIPVFRAATLSFAIAMIAGPALAAKNLCDSIKADTGGDLPDKALFYRPKPVRGDMNPKWKSVYPYWQHVPRGRNVTFAYVVHPIFKRSGVLNIRVRTAAAGAEDDTSHIRIDRTKYTESCGYFGRNVSRRHYARRVSTLTYEEYHQIGKPSTKIRRFHFEYRNDNEKCVRTDAKDRRETFDFARVEAGFIRPVRVAGLSKAKGLGDVYLADLSQVLLAPLGLASGTAQAAPTQRARHKARVADPNARHFSQLQSYIRRYHADDDLPVCMAFSIQSHEADRSSFVSISDFDDGTSFTWSMDWTVAHPQDGYR